MAFTLQIKRQAAANAFLSMAEGMAETDRDDSLTDKVALWDEFFAAVNIDNGNVCELPGTMRELVKHVADNCDDNAHDMGIDSIDDLKDNEDAELACLSSEVLVRAKPDYLLASEIGTRESLELALTTLDAQAAETDTASPEGHRVRCAIEHIKAMLAQRGMEVFKNGDDGSLCDFCDVVIYG